LPALPGRDLGGILGPPLVCGRGSCFSSQLPQQSAASSVRRQLAATDARRWRPSRRPPGWLSRESAPADTNVRVHLQRLLKTTIDTRLHRGPSRASERPTLLPASTPNVIWQIWCVGVCGLRAHPGPTPHNSPSSWHVEPSEPPTWRACRQTLTLFLNEPQTRVTVVGSGACAQSRTGLQCPPQLCIINARASCPSNLRSTAPAQQRGQPCRVHAPLCPVVNIHNGRCRHLHGLQDPEYSIVVSSSSSRPPAPARRLAATHRNSWATASRRRARRCGSRRHQAAAGPVWCC
jgi:hypothetical protein